jgi:hypothetical protein
MLEGRLRAIYARQYIDSAQCFWDRLNYYEVEVRTQYIEFYLAWLTTHLARYISMVKKFQFFECQCCYGEISLEEGPSRPPTQECQHDPVYCSECLTQYVERMIMNGQWKSIKCPDPECKATLDGRDVLMFCPQDVFAM